ncbi:MAG: outer membrane lipoprotein-sorting protein [Acidobacteriota bacterium]|nr:outer membrane lipoprotein-sorting protein [Acidobacteriota bacterium]
MNKVKTYLLLLGLTAMAAAAFAQAGGGLDADAILERVDRNMFSENRIVESSMTVHGRRGSRTMTMRTYSVGDRQSFTEYLSPPREAGTKMLKLEDRLWIYSPSTDRIIQISGHMLRQSVMGSDLSYEDMMEDRKLTDVYDAELVGEETVDGRAAHVLHLKARVADVAYDVRRIWIDAERYAPLREELFAKSGQLLKRTEFSEVKKIEGRWFPTVVLFKDMLKQGDGTEFRMTDIKFDQDIPDHIFSKASLR